MQSLPFFGRNFDALLQRHAIPLAHPSASSGQLDASLLEERCHFFLVQGLT